jgi:hypothetical protein
MKVLFFSIIIKALCLIIFPLVAIRVIVQDETIERLEWETGIINATKCPQSEFQKEHIKYALMQLRLIGRGKKERSLTRHYKLY